MDREIAISVKNVRISYKTLSNTSISRNLFSNKSKKRGGEFEAVKDVSFDIYKGEIVGIVGSNGSGKSTLLKSIAGIFRPNSGTIDTYGHRVSLMSIGVGFNPSLTGRENVVLSGLLLGFSQKYIDEKMNEIIEFSELGDFIDMPVRTYSSGMYSKLSFAITAIMDSEIILVDEVLSVGDVHFQKKSFEKMQSMILDKDRTVIIVSHSLSDLERLCNRIIWLQDGIIRNCGDTKAILKEYQEFMNV